MRVLNNLLFITFLQLSSYSSVHSMYWSGLSDLHVFTAFGSTTTIKKLSENKILLNQKVNNPYHRYHGFTALHIAVDKNSDEIDEIIDILASAGANVNETIQNSESFFNNFTPLQFAVYQGNIKSALALIKAKADINTLIQNNRHECNGMSAIHIAALKGYANIILILVGAGANVDNTTKNDNITALHIAALYNQKESTKSLIAAGANKNIKIKNIQSEFDGRTALDIAKRFNLEDLITLLE